MRGRISNFINNRLHFLCMNNLPSRLNWLPLFGTGASHFSFVVVRYRCLPLKPDSGHRIQKDESLNNPEFITDSERVTFFCYAKL